tara:strand:- start:80 stop:274 length:195 start_codon:yes stop_codon:yes gene_type:complete
MLKLIIKEEYGTAYTINENDEFVGYPINKDGTIDKYCEFIVDYSFLEQHEIDSLEKVKLELVKK